MRHVGSIVVGFLGVLAAIVTVVGFLLDRSGQTKSVEVTILARSTLVDQGLAQTQQRLQLMYDSQPISNFVVFQLRIENVGAQTIRREDFASPISLAFSNVSKLLAVQQSGAEPQNLRVDPQVQATTVEVPSTLMNAGDWFSLEVDTVPATAEQPTVYPTARIAGVKNVEFRESFTPPEKKPAIYDMVLQSALVISVIGQFILNFTKWNPPMGLPMGVPTKVDLSDLTKGR